MESSNDGEVSPLALDSEFYYAPSMFRSGYVAILGVPNVGKSTLMNQLLGERLSIVTEKPQTTRHRILGILHRAQSQIIFLDTPGIHPSEKMLNIQMAETAYQALGEADAVLHMVYPQKSFSPFDHQIAERIRGLKKPHVVLINHIDKVPKEDLLPVIEAIQQAWSPREIIPISALKGDGLANVLVAVEQVLPEGPAYYPKDQYTEHDVRFLCEEIVREKATILLHQELPYALATQVEQYQEGEKLDRIHVAIIVEKSSQKAIVLGAKGQMIKKIGELARKDMEKMLGKKVYLELFVRVEEGWTKSREKLRELGILR